jgi:hypothetical protein
MEKLVFSIKVKISLIELNLRMNVNQWIKTELNTFHKDKGVNPFRRIIFFLIE